MYSPARLDTVVSAYLDACAWSSSAATDTEEFDNLEGFEFSEEAFNTARDTCEAFIEAASLKLAAAGLDDAAVGHNLWLTSARHGAGFWDLGLGELGDELTAIAQTFPLEAYLSDAEEIELA